MDDITAKVHSISNVLLVLSDAVDGCRSKQCCQGVFWFKISLLSRFPRIILASLLFSPCSLGCEA